MQTQTCRATIRILRQNVRCSSFRPAKLQIGRRVRVTKSLLELSADTRICRLETPPNKIARLRSMKPNTGSMANLGRESNSTEHSQHPLSSSTSVLRMLLCQPKSLVE